VTAWESRGPVDLSSGDAIKIQPNVFENFGFSRFEVYLSLSFVSDFDIRILDLFRWLLGSAPRLHPALLVDRRNLGRREIAHERLGGLGLL
jgi:hypothetical protein